MKLESERKGNAREKKKEMIGKCTDEQSPYIPFLSSRQQGGRHFPSLSLSLARWCFSDLCQINDVSKRKGKV